MSRPKGARSSTQKKRNALKQKEIRQLLSEYGKISNKDLAKKYNISESQLRKIRRDNFVKDKNIAKFLKAKVDVSKNDIVSGVYCICRSDFLRAYIGSSKNIISRIKNHLSQLKNKTHYNKEFLNDFKNGCSFYFFLIEECSEEFLLEKENNILSQLNKDFLYNRNFQCENIDEKGCHIWTGVKTKDGYGRIRYKDKEFLTHRVSYFIKHNHFPYLVHHKCNNKLCCNPDHLENSSISNNNINFKVINGTYVNKKLETNRDKIIELRNSGKSIKEIIETLDLKVSISTLSRFCKNIVAL